MGMSTWGCLLWDSCYSVERNLYMTLLWGVETEKNVLLALLFFE